MRAFIESTGAFAIDKYQHFNELIRFSLKCLGRLFQRRNYNSAVWDVLIVQIYFTCVQVFFLFLTVSVLFGLIFMGYILQNIKNRGLSDYLGDIIVGLVFIELVPLITVFLLALRTSSAINTEIAVMKVTRELDTLQAFKIDMVNYLFLPRLISVIISIFILSCFFAMVMSLSGFLFSNLLFDISLGNYTTLILKSITFKDLTIVLMKNFLFAFFIALIPIHSGSQASYEQTAVPVSVLQGMVRVFIAIFVIEVSSLAVRSI